MESTPKPGIYRNFKGGEYEVFKVGRHTETGEEFVVYWPIDDPNDVCLRPMEMFVEEVDRDGYQGPRFTFVRGKE